MKREVAMNIKPDQNSDALRINVEFDLSNLTPEQIADWAVSANGIRVWFQNKERAKGEEHLIELSKKKQVVVVPPCGTRSMAIPLNDETVLKHVLGDKYDAYVAKYESVHEAFEASREITNL